MSGRSGKFFQALVSRINKFPSLSNTSSAVESVSNRAQNKLHNIQLAATEKYDTIAKQINGATVIQDLSVASLKQSAPIPKSLLNYWRWYEQLTGIQDVEAAQQHVIVIQDKLFECQDQRRVLTNQVSRITEKLKEVYGELVQTKRDDPKYVQLTIMENKGLQEQSRINEQLKLLEDAERDHFTRLATAIKEYHDSQAMNAQKYKYLSILASAALAIISLCGSMVYNNRRIQDVRNAIAEAQRKNELTFQQHFQALESRIVDGFNNMTKNKASTYEVLPADVYIPRDVDTIFTATNISIGILAFLLYKIFW